MDVLEHEHRDAPSLTRSKNVRQAPNSSSRSSAPDLAETQQRQQLRLDPASLYSVGHVLRERGRERIRVVAASSPSASPARFRPVEAFDRPDRFLEHALGHEMHPAHDLPHVQVRVVCDVLKDDQAGTLFHDLRPDDASREVLNDLPEVARGILPFERTSTTSYPVT